jgi:four helix bundle protein
MRHSESGNRNSALWAGPPEVLVSEQQIKSYKDLRVWQAAMEIVEHCYRLTAKFPRDEVYGITSQLRRAAVSVPSNIAEGYGRDSTGSYVQFLKIAQGSLKELETLLLVAERVAVAPPGSTDTLLDQCDAAGRMLNGLIRSLRRDEN